ncbi:MAG: hypothetical protein ABIP94_02600 [Planctomycetota bacterium]
MDRRLWLIVALAAAMRAIGCLVHAMPGRDGVSYLWMAEQWAAGHGEQLFRQVFHPLYPWLVGLVLQVWPSLDPVAAGQLVAAGCSGLAVIPLVLATQRLFGAQAATWAGVMFAIGAWFVRHPAECLSEGPFHLFVLAWAASLTAEKPRAVIGGLLAGAAFLIRPEGAALALAGMLWHARRSGWRALLAHAVAAGLVAMLLPLGSLAAGEGFVLTPKAVFNWEVGVGGAEHGVLFYLRELAKLPGDAWEGLGYLVFPLAVLGAWRHRPRLVSLEFALLLPFLMQIVVIPLLRSNLRFVSGLGVLLLPFAGATFAWLFGRVRAPWRWCLVLALVASEAKLWLGRPADRTIERDLGRWLGGQLKQHETLSCDMPRLWFFAGQKPPPPREIASPELHGWAAAPECVYVALRRGRNDAFLGELDGLGFAPMLLPEELRSRSGANDVLLWRRRPR